MVGWFGRLILLWQARAAPRTGKLCLHKARATHRAVEVGATYEHLLLCCVYGAQRELALQLNKRERQSWERPTFPKPLREKGWFSAVAYSLQGFHLVCQRVEMKQLRPAERLSVL